MRIRTFNARTVTQAMAAVRAELGEDAIIIATETDAVTGGARLLAAVADEPASDDDALFDAWNDAAGGAPDPCADGAATGSAAGSGGGGDGQIRAALAFHAIPAALLARLLRTADGFATQGNELALGAALDAALTFQPFTARASQRPIALVGPPGVGKTLVAAKLLVDGHRRGRPLLAVSCDLQRAGGVSQLEAFTRILGIELATADGPEALRAIIDGADRSALAVIDTAGATPWIDGELAALRALVQSAAAEPVLVLAAGTDALEAAEQACAFARMGCRRMVATRLDTSRRLGALLAAGDAARLAFAGVGADPHAASPLSPLNPVSLARLLLAATALASAA